jgi:hypothetical protein
MKGLDEIQWTLITVSVAIVVLIAVLQPIQAAIDQSIANSERLMAEELRSVINLIQAYPDITTHTINIMTRKCTINVDQKSVSVFIKTKVTLDLMQTDNIVQKAEIDCMKSRQLIIRKSMNQITVQGID